MGSKNKFVTFAIDGDPYTGLMVLNRNGIYYLNQD